MNKFLHPHALKQLTCHLRSFNVSSVLANESSKTNGSSSSDLIFNNENKSNQKAENISRAMTYYLKKLSERDALMNVKTQEYEIGKRHLAKMMGVDADLFPQKLETNAPRDLNSVEASIEYLLPSGLFEKKARPFMKSPVDYYPKSDLAAFGKDGRPLNSFFYTRNHGFYKFLHVLTQKILDLNKLEDASNLVGRKFAYKRDEDGTSKINMTGSVWMSRLNLIEKLECNIDELNYQKFLILMQKLVSHPFSKKEQTFVDQFKIPFEPPVKLTNIEKCKLDGEGRSFQEFEYSQKTSLVKLRLYEGTGIIKIKAPEGQFDISFFEAMTHREQILFPFKVIDRINKFDMLVEVNSSGMSCLAKSLRYAISNALCSFVSANDIEKLRLSGCLTKEWRLKERKKPGQQGARRKYTWKAR
jgi:small subunit ribosomal protein S9